MTTTTTYQGMEPGAKSSSRVLQPPGGGSNISFGTDDNKPVTRKNRTASNIFAEPEDPHAHRRNNPPGGKPTGILCGEPSAPLRRCHAQPVVLNNSLSEEAITGDGDQEKPNTENVEEPEIVQESDEGPPQPSAPSSSVGGPPGRRNPPGGKSSLILG